LQDALGLMVVWVFSWVWGFCRLNPTYDVRIGDGCAVAPFNIWAIVGRVKERNPTMTAFPIKKRIASSISKVSTKVGDRRFFGRIFFMGPMGFMVYMD
jgi:hypothetical protein